MRSLSYRNRSTDLQSKSMDWFLYHGVLVKCVPEKFLPLPSGFP